jgi:hypothetical protein
MVLKTTIACYLSDKHIDWDLYLPKFTFTMNTVAHSATGFSPAYLNYGREITAPTGLDSIPEGQVQIHPTLPNVGMTWHIIYKAVICIHL